ncbi:MAG TPA: hypothetical protein VK279_08020, partial [Solirubrobacteraceae bacterium]|nr:hypothetical protein [Solirubrobacteraceae bacterium]
MSAAAATAAAAARSREHLWTAAATLRSHPRHAGLGAFVAGLLAAPASRPAVAALGGVALVLAAVVWARPGMAATMALLALGGGLLAGARLDALQETALGPLMGRQISVEAVLMERPRPQAGGGRRALARLRTGRGAGETVLIRVARPRARAGRVAASGGASPAPAARRAGGPAMGAVVRVNGRLVRLRRWDRWAARRGAHGVVLAWRVAPTGARRGGVAGALDRVRDQAERSLAA